MMLSHRLRDQKLRAHAIGAYYECRGSGVAGSFEIEYRSETT